MKLILITFLTLMPQSNNLKAKCNTFSVCLSHSAGSAAEANSLALYSKKHRLKGGSISSLLLSLSLTQFLEPYSAATVAPMWFPNMLNLALRRSCPSYFCEPYSAASVAPMLLSIVLSLALKICEVPRSQDFFACLKKKFYKETIFLRFSYFY